MYENRRVKMIHIMEPPHQLRMNFDEEKLYELAESLKQHGLINPITLHEDEERKLIIVAGHRRFLAAQMLKWETIDARIKNAMTGIEVVTISAIENLQRADLDLIEEADLITKMHYNEKLSIGIISDMLNRSKSWVQARLEIMMFQPEVLQELQLKTLKLGAARLIAGIQEEGFRKWILDQAVNAGATEAMVSTWIKDNFISLSEKQRQEIIDEASQTTSEFYEKTKFTCVLCLDKDTLEHVMIVRCCKVCYMKLQEMKANDEKEKRQNEARDTRGQETKTEGDKQQRPGE